MVEQFYKKAGKRICDLVVCSLGGALLFPLILIIALLVRIKLGSPVIFRQQRPGLDGKPFMLWKFRTMTDEKDSDGQLLPDAERLTTFGKFLRSTSLDELPTLCNVFKGEMSLVGPRPLLMKYLSVYTPEQMRRHDVLPGITGWAQANGRNAISWEEKFAKDVWYVENQSLAVDLKTIWLTISAVIKREGISQSNHVTMPEFRGSALESGDPHHTRASA